MGNSRKYFRKNLDQYLRNKKITKAELARRTSLSRSNIDAYLKGNSAPGLDVIDGISDALGIESFRLLLDPENPIVKPIQPPPSLEEAFTIVRDFMKSVAVDGGLSWPIDRVEIERILKGKK